MNLPIDLEEALEKEIASHPHSKLITAAQELSQRYRHREGSECTAFMTSEAHRLAYLAVRMPATYAAVRRVLSELRQRCPQLLIKSILDVGAGPATATWAAVEVFSELSQAILLEKDACWLDVGKRLMRYSRHAVLQTSVWRQCDLRQLQLTDFNASDIVIMSYIVGELPQESFLEAIAQGWKATSQILVLIEPGTPHGFARIKEARHQLLSQGASLIAPCPHKESCPMPKNDWCHFAERLERSSTHKSIKEVALGYEDEKFSYLIASKYDMPLPTARILRHPQHHSGHINFSLCTVKGLEELTLSRRHGELYKKARKLDWGDILLD